MMRQHTPMPSKSRPVIGTTPFSNFLLDRAMPRLRDTEWRLICVIVRQTFGWSTGDGGRKQSDWLSHFQLKRRTGRSSSAVSRGIDVLVRSGLVIVRDSFGRPLRTARSRQLARCRLSFSLSPAISMSTYQRRFGYVRFGTPQSQNDKSKFDKRKQQTQFKHSSVPTDS